jgi:hypothetical protein
MTSVLWQEVSHKLLCLVQQIGVYRGRQLAGHAVLLPGVLSVTTESLQNCLSK